MAIAERQLTVSKFLALPEEEPALELEPDGAVTQKAWAGGQHSAIQAALGSLLFHAGKKHPHLNCTDSGGAFDPEV